MKRENCEDGGEYLMEEKLKSKVIYMLVAYIISRRERECEWKKPTFYIIFAKG